MSLYPYANKRAMVYNMGHGDNGYQTLLDGMSTKEILILKKHPDLIDKVKDITKMTLLQLLAELKDEFNLEVDQYNSNDQWISTENLEDAIPEWFTTNHCGWFKDSRDDEFLDWARNFLMQEVRINIWLRYLEHKKDHPKVTPSYGMYL
jgi:hypothetical protein